MSEGDAMTEMMIFGDDGQDGPEESVGLFSREAVDDTTLVQLDTFAQSITANCKQAEQSARAVALEMAEVQRVLQGTEQDYVKWAMENTPFTSARTIRRVALHGRFLSQYDAPELDRFTSGAIDVLVHRDDEEVELVLDAVRSDPEPERKWFPADVRTALGEPTNLKSHEKVPKSPPPPPPPPKIVVSRDDLPPKLAAFLDSPMWADGFKTLKEVGRFLELMEKGLPEFISQLETLINHTHQHEQLLRAWILMDGDAALPAKLNRVLETFSSLKTTLEFHASDTKEIEGMKVQLTENAPIPCGACKGEGCHLCKKKGWLPKRYRKT